MADTSRFSRQPFIVKKHRSPAQYVRHYAQGVADQNKPTTLAVKQYIPVSNQTPQNGDVTIICAPAIGYVKELYEPLFEDLEVNSAAHGYRIRSIWVADPATLGESALLNKDNMGNQPSWWDHSRDLLLMINTFRASMPQPLVGLGHSIGAAQLAYLSILHPSLLSSLILVEPAMNPRPASPQVEVYCRYTIHRREEWPTRAEGEAAISRNPLYMSWDPRAVVALKKYGLVETAAGGVRNACSKHQEAALVLKPNFNHVGNDGLENMTAEERRALQNVGVDDSTIRHPNWRPEMTSIAMLLPNMQPSVLYVGSLFARTPEMREMRLATTGIGQGGSGGHKLGRVKQVILDTTSHTIPMDGHMGEVVSAAGSWLGTEMRVWRNREEAFQRGWKAKSSEEKSSVDPVQLASFMDWTRKQGLRPVINSRM